MMDESVSRGESKPHDEVVGEESRPTPHPIEDATTAEAAAPSSQYPMIQKAQEFRQFCGKIVNNERVQLFIVFLIAVNAVMMGIATFDFVTENPSTDSAFELVDLIFLIIFTIELAFQLIYHGAALFLDGWLVFDFIIIVVSWSFSSVQIIRAFRIFRALRLITRVKVMKNLVLAVFSVMPRMAAIGLLLMLIFYIFAVMMTQLFKDLYDDDDDATSNYFGRLDHTLFTLFQIMTLDAWGDVAREVMEYRSWAWIPFLVFVTISGFIVVNLIIAVICDAVSSLHEDVKAKIHGTYAEGESDADGTNPMDVREQIEALEDQVDELTRVQEQMLSALEILTMNFQKGNM